MRQTWTDTHYALRPEDQPVVCALPNRVSLSLPGYMLDGQGFSLVLTRDHRGVIVDLLAALDALSCAPCPTDADPF